MSLLIATPADIVTCRFIKNYSREAHLRDIFNQPDISYGTV